MFTVAFWKATIERVVATFAVALISTIGVGAEVLDIRQIQWGQAFGIAGGAALLTLVKCIIAGTGVSGSKGSPSLVNEATSVLPAPPSLAERADQERLVPGHVKKVSHQSGPPTTRTTGPVWPRDGASPPD